VFKATGVGLDEDGAIRRAPWFFGIGVGSELRAWFEERCFKQLEIGETPDLVGGSGGLFDAHEGIGGERAIDFRQHHDTVGTVEDTGVRGVCCAGATQVFAILIEFDETAAIATVLKRAEDVLVRQAQVGVRVHVAVDVSEGAGNARMQRIAQVEEEGATGLVIVGEEDAARGHGVFGVVHEFCLLIVASVVNSWP
jgi:hypothetical protein